jgi:iron complex outermembrane recepter protein
MRVTSARAALFGTVAAAALYTNPAAAQTAQQTTQEAQQQPSAKEATAAPDAEGKDTATGEIVVTARRTEERLQRVPGSVSAFNERALDRIQATDTTGLEGAVPNLNIVQGRGSSNATNIYIRGIGQPDALQTFDPGVGVYVDDVYLSRIRGNQLDLLDVERLEVLRGPQGTLYGKNTIGGAIKFVTRKPGQDTRANASLTLGTFNQVDIKAAASGPITNNIALGVAVIKSRHDGYVRDEVLDRNYNDKNSIGGRAALAFTPSTKLRVDLTADYSHDHAHLNVGRPVNNLVSAFGVVLPVTDPEGSGQYDWHGRTTPGLPNSTKLTHYGFSGTVAYDLTDGLTFKSITAYRNLKTDDYIDIDASQWKVGDVFVGVRQHQTSQEFQLTHSGEKLNAVFGLYYLNEKVRSHQEAYADDYLRFSLALPPFTFTRFIDDDLNTNSYAAYGNASYEIAPKLRLSGGLRYTHETKDYDRLTTITSTFVPLNGASYGFNPPRGKWNDLSPMASVDYQVTPATMLYVRAAKGFKSGGFNGRANSALESSSYKPEKVWSYEAGFKTTIADQLRLNGDVFYNDYKDFQARVGDTDTTTTPATPLLTVLNVGKLHIKGAELEANWTPVSGLLLDTQIGYLDAKYVEFHDIRFPNQSRAFQTPAFSPKWTMRFGAQYGFGLGGNHGGITLGGQARYKSRTALAVDNTFYTGAGNNQVGTTTPVEGLFQRAYWTYDARIVWEDSAKRFAIGVYGNNLTNKRYKTDAQEFSSVGNIRTVYYGAPRTVSLRLTARY